MGASKNKKIFVELSSILVVVFVFLVGYKYFYEKGLLLPHYFEWKENTIYIDTKAYEIAKQHEFDAPEFDYHITKLELKNKKFTAYSLDKVCFETEADYKVQDFLYVDVDNDKNNEIVLLLWKRGKYGKYLPFFIESNDMSWDQHIFIFDIKDNKIKPKWCSSYIEVDVKELSFDNRKIFTIIDKNGGRTRYKWLSWGLENINPSKYDFDNKSDKIISEAKISAVGDNLINESILRYGEKHDSNYDFLYEHIKDDLKENNINIINHETVLVPKGNKLSAFPKFASPLTIGDAVKNAGFNVVALANNHILDMGELGIKTTVDYYKNNGVDVLGIKEKNQENFIIKEINGIKIGIINFTEFINSMSFDEIKYSNINNLIDERQAKKDLDDVVRKSDVTIALVHWGDEYSEDITHKQKYWSKIFLDKGIDIVIGSHPHILQKNEFYTNDKGQELLVYYSIGNFVSNQQDIKTILSGMVNLDIVKTNNGIKFKNFSLEPLITHKENDYATTYYLKDYTDELVKRHSQKIDISNIKTMFNDYESSLVDKDSVIDYIISYDAVDKTKDLSSKAIRVKSELFKKIRAATSVKKALGSDGNKYTIISFGKYNGEDLKWRLLDIKNNIAYLECINVIDKKIFDDNVPKSFKESDLHNFLNTEFIRKAFDNAEAEYVSTFGVSVNCTSRFINLGFDINDKSFLKSEDGDYWLLNLCNENENTSNIIMGKYVDEDGNILNGNFSEIHGVKPVLKVPFE